MADEKNLKGIFSIVKETLGEDYKPGNAYGKRLKTYEENMSKVLEGVRADFPGSVKVSEADARSIAKTIGDRLKVEIAGGKTAVGDHFPNLSEADILSQLQGAMLKHPETVKGLTDVEANQLTEIIRNHRTKTLQEFGKGLTSSHGNEKALAEALKRYKQPQELIGTDTVLSNLVAQVEAQLPDSHEAAKEFKSSNWASMQSEIKEKFADRSLLYREDADKLIASVKDDLETILTKDGKKEALAGEIRDRLNKVKTDLSDKVKATTNSISSGTSASLGGGGGGSSSNEVEDATKKALDDMKFGEKLTGGFKALTGQHSGFKQLEEKAKEAGEEFKGVDGMNWRRAGAGAGLVLAADGVRRMVTPSTDPDTGEQRSRLGIGAAETALGAAISGGAAISANKTLVEAMKKAGIEAVKHV